MTKKKGSLLRPNSLRRLFLSLDRTDFAFEKNNPGWQVCYGPLSLSFPPGFDFQNDGALQVELEIRIDGGGGEKGEKVRELARNWNWSHGAKVAIVILVMLLIVALSHWGFAI